jgi:L-idonate 5-dehydrogenase
MKAFSIRGKSDGSLVELAMPTPDVGQVRVKVVYVGICGSDLHYYFDGANGSFVLKEALIPGHEMSGIIDFDPSGEYSTGTRVTLHPAILGQPSEGIEDRPNLWPGGGYLGSASTWPHTQGAMSEYFIAAKDMIRPLPLNLPLHIAALAEPLGVAIHAINIGGGVAGKKILVSGSGPIGLLVAAAAKVLGANSITASDVLRPALDRALAMGATRVIHIGLEELPPNEFDLVFECSAAASAVSGALVAVRCGGIVVQVGMLVASPVLIAIAPLIAKEVQLRGTFRFNAEIADAVSMLTDNQWMGQVISQTYGSHQIVEAFEMAKNSDSSGKVLVRMGEE